jgi:hypothetical protein
VSGVARNMMGSIEVIEMGNVTGAVDVSDCDKVNGMWLDADGDWATNASAYMSAPSGGLSGNSFLINVASAYSVTMPVTAINGWSDTVQHKGPSSTEPTLAGGVSTALVGDRVLDYPSKANGGVLATSSLLAANMAISEVQVEEGILASTDVVFSYPTKQFFVSGSTPVAPFTAVYDPTAKVSSSCETVKLTSIDREGYSSTGNYSFSGANSDGVEGDLCDDVTVVSFGNQSPLGVGQVKIDAAFGYQNGQAKFVGSQKLPADDNGVVVGGLPVIGFAATQVANGVRSYGYSSGLKTRASMTVTSN